VPLLTTPTEVDRGRSSKKPALGGSLFSSSGTPTELKPVESVATAVQKADLTTRPAIATANQDYEKLSNPNNAKPSPPVHAAELSALVKKLAVAESAVADGIKARQALISGLESLLAANKTKLEQENAQLVDLKTRKDAIDARKREVEQAIMKGLSADDQHAISAAPLPGLPTSHSRPDVEELTPPPVESFTPVGSPRQDAAPEVHDPAPAQASSVATYPVPASAPGVVLPNAIDAVELLRTIGQATPQGAQTAPQGFVGDYGQGSFKKRKMSRSAAEDEFAAFAGDDDVKGIDSNLGDLI
jgi:regulator of Ty1 transposition protein 103